MLVRVAELLGVAGIDVPIKEMKKWITPYKVKITEISCFFNTNIKVPCNEHELGVGKMGASKAINRA